MTFTIPPQPNRRERAGECTCDAGSPLLRTGLQEGDLITYDSIKSEMRNPERASVTRRFIALLSQIKR